MAFWLNESFTSGVSPTPGWWASSSGNHAYATSPAPLEGSYSLRPATSGQDLFIRSSDTSGEQWGHFLINCPALPASFQNVLIMASAAFNNVFVIKLLSTGSVGIDAQGVFAFTSGTISAGTTYHVWWRLKPGTGSNSELQLWLNTANDRSGSPGTLQVSGTTGNSTEGITYHQIPGNSNQLLYDVIQAADTDEFSGAPAAGSLIYKPRGISPLLVR